MADALESAGLHRLWRNGLLMLVFALGAWAWAGGLLPAIFEQWYDVTFLTQEHIELVIVSGGLAIIIGVPVGVLLTRPAFRRYGDIAA